MKFTKMLGLLAIAVAAMMAFAGIASAALVTSPANTPYTGTIAAASHNGHVSLHGSNGVTIECASTVEGKVETHGKNAKGETETAEGNISKLTFTNCTNNYTVHTKKAGRLIAHSTGTKNATLTSTGTEVEVTGTLFGSPITCIYATTNTHIGTLTGSTTTKGKATLDISANIPRTGGSALCGSTGVWTGGYVVNTPAFLDVD